MARLDELERKFEENPRRYFAPLANEYRKAGDARRAAELCRAQLPEVPGHISGHIVLGQALFDTAEFAGSRAALETALALDPENIVALRYLGDIARATGDSEEAARWYSRTLEADPYNEAATLSLQSLRASAPAAGTTDAEPSAPGFAPASYAMEPESNAVEPESTAVEPELTAVEPESTAVVPEPTAVEPEPTDAAEPLAAALDVMGEDIASPESADQAEPVAGSPVELEASVLEDTQSAQAFAGDLAISTAADPGEQTVTDLLEIAPVKEAAATEVAPVEVEPIQVPQDQSIPAEPAPAEVEPAEAAATELYDVAAHAPPEPFVEEAIQAEERVMESAAPFVTETMADLYMEQGYPHEALELLLQLAEQRPQDEQLREKIENIEAVIVARRDAAVAAARAERAETTQSAIQADALRVEEFTEPVEPTPAGEAVLLFEPPVDIPISVREMFARMDRVRPRPANAPTARPLSRLRSDFMPMPDASATENDALDDPFAFPNPPHRAEEQPGTVSRASGPQPAFNPSTAPVEDFDAWLRGLKGP